MSVRPWEDASGLYTGTYDTTDVGGDAACDMQSVNPVWHPNRDEMNPEGLAYARAIPGQVPTEATTATDVMVDPMPVTPVKKARKPRSK